MDDCKNKFPRIKSLHPHYIKCFGIPILLSGLSFVILSGCGDIDGILASLSISPSSSTIGINKTVAFSAVGKDSTGKIISSISPTWRADAAIGAISSSGLFTAASREATGYVSVSAEALSAQALITITTKGGLTGKVSSTSGNIQGIKVFLNGTSLNDFSDSTGKYTISNITAGTYEAKTLETSLYLSSSVEVTVGSGETVTQDFILTIKPGVPTIPTTTLPF